MYSIASPPLEGGGQEVPSFTEGPTAYPLLAAPST